MRARLGGLSESFGARDTSDLARRGVGVESRENIEIRWVGIEVVGWVFSRRTVALQ